MMTTEISPQQLARLRVLFALRRMPPALQNDVLADGTIAAGAGIDLSHPITLLPNLVIDRDVLFEQFKKAADGEEVRELIDRESVKHPFRVEVSGPDGFVVTDTTRIRFANAALLTVSVETRRALAKLCLERNTLSLSGREEFERLIAKGDFDHDDFFAASRILGSAPENFADTLRDAAKTGTLSRSDFIPDELAHWENLTTRRIGSKNLAEFIATELAAERAARVARDSSVAVDLISITFGAPELVPIELFRTVDHDTMLQAVTRITSYIDPTALAGLFAVCADRVSKDARFVDAGTAILEKLLADPAKLQEELTTFATAFVLATDFLARHQNLKKEPVFWRRLVAAAHASLVTRVLGGSGAEEGSLFAWALNLCGKSYYFSVLTDSYVEPRWRPDWISANYVAADIYGRLAEAVRTLGDRAPANWIKTIDKARPWVDELAGPIALAYPAVLQGGSSAPIAKAPAETQIGQLYSNFIASPTVENLLILMPVVYAFGLDPDAREAALKAIQSLRHEAPAPSDQFYQAALDMGAFIAARSKDAALAEAIAMAALERFADTASRDNVMPTMAVLVECAAALADRSEALTTLARRLENLSFIAPAEILPGVVDSLQTLRAIDEGLSVRLGRAFATARLGMRR
jgi:hypothetical protein